MLRIRFSLEDFARLRMTSGLGPVAESIFALDTFSRHGDPSMEEWRRRTTTRLGGRADEVRMLVRNHRPVPELLQLLEQRSPLVAGRRASTVFAFCQAAVLPYWSRLHGRLEHARETWGRLAITDGVESVLANTHPRLRWNPPVLEVLDAPDQEIALDGRGMLLSPSVFLVGRPLVIKEERESGLPAVVFPVAGDAYALTDPADDWEPVEQVLGALIGATRAAALFALTESCTTGTLAERLGISLAGASKHATVLRRAGLVTTTRTRNTALHTLTSLGMALLQREQVTAGAA